MNNIVKPFPNIVLNALHVLAYLILIILCKVELLASTLQIKNSIEKLNNLSKFTKVGVETILQIEMLTCVSLFNYIPIHYTYTYSHWCNIIIL